MAKAAAAAALLHRELDGLSGAGDRTSRSTQNVTRDNDELAKSANKTDSSINQLTGRIGLLAQGVAVLGPALVPIGAVGIPAVAGLANQLGAAAIAGGTALLAFQGVGAALKALNTAQLTPTAENIAKAQQALRELSPAAAAAVLHLQELKPVLEGIRNAAASGLFPGVDEALTSLETRVPEVERILTTVGHVTGDLLAQGADSLASKKWDDFFAFLDREAPRTIASLGHTVGDLTHGLAELWMAFEPTNNDFATWLETAARDFDTWATGLDRTQGFKDFIAYVQETGPQVAHTLGALADAVLQIVEAAAPLGGPTLHAIELLAKAVASIADSPLGTPLLAAASATAIWARSTQLLGMAGETAWGARAKSNITGMVGALTNVTTAQERATTAAGALTRRQTELRNGLATLGKGAALAGGLAFVTSGLADRMHVANTASLALVGTLGGPWGIAVGAAAGAVMDAAHANDDFVAAQKRAQAVLRDSPADFKAQEVAIRDAGTQLNAFAQQTQLGLDDILSPLHSLTSGALPNAIKGIFGQSDVEQQAAAIEKLNEQMGNLRTTWSVLGNAVSGNKFGDVTHDIGALEQIARSAQPAMDALGISIGQLNRMRQTDPAGFTDATNKIKAWIAVQDSVPGRTRAVGKAIAGLGNQLLSTADSAGQLGSALDALLTPGLDAEKATDALHQSLKDMKTTLDGNAKSFSGYSKAALENRDATRTVTENTVAMLTAMAKNGDSQRQVANALRNTRQELIAEGVAAGFSHDQMVRRANAMGLTPKLVRTVFQSAGIDLEQRQVDRLKGDIRALPKDVRTKLRTEGYDLSSKQIRQLTHEYHLTPKQVRTLLEAKDHASELINHVQKQGKKLDHSTYTAILDANWQKAFTGIGNVDNRGKQVDRQKYSPTVDAQNKPALGKIQQVKSAGQQLDNLRFVPTIDANDGAAFAAIANVRAALSNIPDQTVYIHVKKVGAQADGGIVGGYGSNGRYYPRVSQIVPGGANILWAEPETRREAYISDKPGARERNIGLLQQVASWFDLAMVRRQAADGLLLERPMAMPATVGSGAASVTVDLGAALNGARLVLDLGSQRTLTGYIAGVAKPVAETVVAGDHAHLERTRPKTGRR
jgi:hypothetical protein